MVVVVVRFSVPSCDLVMFLWLMCPAVSCPSLFVSTCCWWVSCLSVLVKSCLVFVFVCVKNCTWVHLTCLQWIFMTVIKPYFFLPCNTKDIFYENVLLDQSSLFTRSEWVLELSYTYIQVLLFGKMWPGLNFPKLTISVWRKGGQMGVTWGCINDDMSFIFITVICVSIIPESYFYCTLGFVNKTRHVSHVIRVKNRR